MSRTMLFIMFGWVLSATNIFAQNAPTPQPAAPTIAITSVDRWRPGSVNNTNYESSRVETGRTLVLTLDLLNSASVNDADQWLNHYKKNPGNFATVSITINNTVEKINFPVSALFATCKRSASACAQTNFTAGSVKLFLELSRTLPKESFAVEIDLGKAFLSSDTVIKQEADDVAELYPSTATEDNQSPPPPEEKNLERNLDLGVTFTSAVEEEDVPATGTSPATTIRRRKNRGVLDLGFAPWLDVLKPVIRRNRALWFWTPAFIKANVATGKIEEDTLSLNRILIGTDFEMRYYRSRNGELSSPTTGWIRLNFGLIHASDRDFKQKEIYANAEFKPVWGKLFKPYALNYTIEKINGKGIKKQRPVGFTVEPLIGFAFGRTYSRRNPAEAIKPKDTFVRFSLGGTAALSIKDRFIFTAEHKFYIRSETTLDRYENYSKLTGEFRLGSNRYFSNGIFASYEKGSDAPFTSNVNAFRVGYRLWGNWCQPFCR